MKVVKEVAKTGAHYGWRFFCPGCQENHVVGTGWGFNGNHNRPTFTPSIKVTGTRLTVSGKEAMALIAQGVKKLPHVDTVCHSFVIDGKIQFLGDCTHELAGQTVELPEMET